MSRLVFSRSQNSLTLHASSGTLIGGPWEAYNNPQSSALPWPNGTYPFSWHSPHPESGPNDSFGSCGNFIFDVPGREGLGVHSGRANSPAGPGHSTDGCIRTTDDAMQSILGTHRNDRLTQIEVQ